MSNDPAELLHPEAFAPVAIAEPQLTPALTNCQYYVEDLSGTRSLDPVPIYLIPESNPSRAYQKVPGAGDTAIKRYFRKMLRCSIYDCQVLERVDNNTFRETDHYVKVKFFLQDAIHQIHREGLDENVWTEISVAQRHGNGIHIAECIEALRDEKGNLYMVMELYRGGSLAKNIPIGGFIDTDYDIRPLILQIARKIRHFHKEPRALVHRDLSTDQVLLKHRLVDMQRQQLPENFAVLIDFAMALGITYVDGRPQNILPRDTISGKSAYLTPEVKRQQEFGQKVDTWCLGVMIFVCITGMTLYEQPGDSSYRLFVQQRGLLPGRNALLRRTEAALAEAGITTAEILRRVHVVLRLPNSLRLLLASIFQEEPERRPELDEIMKHKWFHQRCAYRDDVDRDADALGGHDE